MADNLAPVPAVSPGPATTSLAQDALHYLAGGALLALTAYLTMQGKIDGQLLATLIVAAAAGIGFKLKG